ncbi:MAG: hypothetical protein ABIO70_32475 [Pseudomonadota bacterium]
MGDICSQDFGDIVTELSLNTSRLRDTFFLSAEPDASSIKVQVNSEVVECDAGVWSYQRKVDEETGEEKPAIVFERTQMPPSSSQISVQYFYGSGAVAGFCGSSTDTGE